MKRISALTAAVMAVNIVLGVPVITSGEETVLAISTPEDLKTVTEACVYDSYSRGKRIVMTNDIDLKGEKIKPIEVFCGTFDGGGHSILNLDMEFEGSNKGFFTEITDEGTVCNLNIQGKISVKDDDEKKSAKNTIGEIMKNVGIESDISESKAEVAGGIAGKNAGKIVNCAFDGSISGSNTVGGVVGENVGVVESCLNAASVSGTENTGGISGRNKGIIRKTKNSGNINTEPDENSRNAGGIAGINEGAIQASDNSGAVGYQAVGNNIGGVAGVHSGEISECTNSGKILGRKSVGGIAGRFEPYADVKILSEAVRAEFQEQIDQINGVMDDTKDEIVGFADDLTGRASDFADVLKKFRLGNLLPSGGLFGSRETSGSTLGDALGDAVGKVADSVVENNKSSRDNTAKIADSLSKAIDKIDGSSDTKDALTGAIDSLADLNREASDAVSGMKDSVSEGADSLNGLSEDAKKNITGISDAMQEAMDSLGVSADKFGNAGGELADLLSETTNMLTANDGKLSDRLDDVGDRLDDVQKDVIDPLITSMQQTNRALRGAAGALEDILDDTNSGLVDPVTDLIEDIEKRAKKLEELNKKIDEIKQDIKDKIKDEINNAKSTPKPSASVSPSASVKKTASIASALKDFMLPSVYAAEEDVSIEDSVNSLKNITSLDVNIKRDIMGFETDAGVIEYSYNSGEIDGSASAGGIAGNVGVENLAKNGESITLSNGTELKAGSVVKAVIKDCINESNVTSKTKYAGGIAGEADLGTIKECIGTGNIKVTDGSHAGGIAGRSLGTIDRCIGIADMDADSDLGGIAGQASDILECYALPRIADSNAEKAGAIAGSADGKVSFNYFIKEGLSGIDGADLGGRAVALESGDITSSDGKLPPLMEGFGDYDWYMGTDDIYLPQVRSLAENSCENIGTFLKTKSSDYARFHFRVWFVIDGEAVKSMTVAYNTIIDPAEVPPLEERDGYYPVWDKDTSKPIIRNTVFNAEYRNATGTISSGEDPPLILAEGNFTDDARLTAEMIDISRDFEGYKKAEAYTFEITPAYSGTLRIHVRDESGKDGKIGIINNGKAQVIDCERDGRYLVFDIDSPSDFVILHKKTNPTVIVITAAGIMMMLGAAAAVFIGIRRRKGKNKGVSV